MSDKIMVTKTRAQMTEELTKAIFMQTRKMGTFGCFEVTIGFGGSERVDYMTYNSKGDVHCYEIKSSKEDFYSSAAWSFVGHYNYFVMTEETYEQVKSDVPNGVGVYIGGRIIAKRATRKIVEDMKTLKDSMIRSLYRDFEKSYFSNDVDYMQRLKNENARLNRHQRDAVKMKGLLSQIRHLVRHEKNSRTLAEKLEELFDQY